MPIITKNHIDSVFERYDSVKKFLECLLPSRPIRLLKALGKQSDAYLNDVFLKRKQLVEIFFLITN